ncbi:RND transporter, partial [Burkholderia pseudomallei]
SGVGGAHPVIDIHEAGAAQRAADAKRTGVARMLRANGKTEAAQASVTASAAAVAPAAPAPAAAASGANAIRMQARTPAT